jgi:hypothetical protein
MGDVNGPPVAGRGGLIACCQLQEGQAGVENASFTASTPI